MNPLWDQRLRTGCNAALWAFAAVCTLSIALQNFFFVALAAWLVRRFLVQRRPVAMPAWGWLWVAFMAWALLASYAAPNQAASLQTWRKWLLAAAAWCVADAVEDRRQLRGLLGTLLVGAALVNLGASLWYGSQPFLALARGEAWSGAYTGVAYHWVYDTEWRARGGSGGYMVLAGCDSLLILFFSALALEDPFWRRRSVLLCLASLGLGLVLTMTRGAWIATALGLAGLLLWRRPRLGLAIVALLVLLPLLLPGSVFVRRLKTVGDPDNDSNRERVYMAQAGLGIIRDHPWLGVGDSLSSFDRPRPDGSLEHVTGYFRQYRSPEAVAWYNLKAPDRENGHLHDVPLQLAVMYGLPGLALALVFFAGLVAQGFRMRLRAAGPLARGAGLGLAFGLIAFFLHGMTEYNLGSFQSSFTLWFVIGLGLAAARLDAQGTA
jgi:O-antigen ligase